METVSAEKCMAANGRLLNHEKYNYQEISFPNTV